MTMNSNPTPHHNEEMNIGNLEELVNCSPDRILEKVYNLLMLAERSMYLQSNTNTKGNGYYERNLGTGVGKLNLNVPRVRDATFRPQILPETSRRDNEDRERILSSLFSNSYSKNAIGEILNSLDLHYSSKELLDLVSLYEEEFDSWNNRELPKDVIGIFVDAYHSSIKYESKIKETSCYIVQTIDFNGVKDIAGVYVCRGRESKEYWLTVFNDLIERGIKRPLIIVTDDFSGVKDAVGVLFPETLHQLCYVHLQRNIRRNMSKEDSKEFNKHLSQIRSYTLDDAKEDINILFDKYEEKYPSYIKYLKERVDNYLAFLNLPEEVRKYFYTTNTVESFNSIIEKIRQMKGGFFQSEKVLTINIYLKYKSLFKKWKNGIPLIKGNLYSLRQIFAKTFGVLPE